MRKLLIITFLAFYCSGCLGMLIGGAAIYYWDRTPHCDGPCAQQTENKKERS